MMFNVFFAQQSIKMTMTTTTTKGGWNLNGLCVMVLMLLTVCTPAESCRGGTLISKY